MTPESLKKILVACCAGLVALMVFGLIWAFLIAPERPQGFGWYLFSYAMGLTMIVLPCTLPLAFVIVPLSMGKGIAKGFGIAIFFGLGVALTLSLYGVLAAILGKVAIVSLSASLENVKNWAYFLAGAIAFLFALGELKLINFRMPSYLGAAPQFIQKQQVYLKALFLGLFMGNIGVGCPHPATPLILIEIARAGDIFYGWSLFFVHAIGRVVPLFLLAFLGILGVNSLKWLTAHIEKLEKATGWTMVFVAGFILTLGLFTHDWWVLSGQHTLLEEITQEEKFLGIISKRLGTGLPHTHGPEELLGKTGLLGLPLGLGTWVLLFLWIWPLWWNYFKKNTKIKNMQAQALPNNNSNSRWHFWFLVAFSGFLIVTFGLYLPLKFQHQALVDEMSQKPHLDQAHSLTQYHQEGEILEGLVVNFNVSPAQVVVGNPVRLDFFVNQKPDNIPFTNLELDHERLMHVIGVRNDLQEFFHIHPEPTQELGLFSIEHIFKKPGLYKFWSEIKAQGINHIFGHPEILVQGEGEPFQKKVEFKNNVIVDSYQVALRLENLTVPFGKEIELLFDIHTLDSHEVELENYFGTLMHLTIIKDDLKQFLHTHPQKVIDHHHQGINIIPKVLANGGGHDTSKEDHGLSFKITFPEPGLYKAFAQFRPKGIDLPQDQALLAEFWIRAQESSTGRISPWWFNLIWSSIAILILSWLTRNYILRAKV